MTQQEEIKRIFREAMAPILELPIITSSELLDAIAKARKEISELTDGSLYIIQEAVNACDSASKKASQGSVFTKGFVTDQIIQPFSCCVGVSRIFSVLTPLVSAAGQCDTLGCIEDGVTFEAFGSQSFTAMSQLLAFINSITPTYYPNYIRGSQSLNGDCSELTTMFEFAPDLPAPPNTPIEITIRQRSVTTNIIGSCPLDFVSGVIYNGNFYHDIPTMEAAILSDLQDDFGNVCSVTYDNGKCQAYIISPLFITTAEITLTQD